MKLLNPLKGNHIYLREVVESDANESYYQWLNNPEINRFLEIRFSRNSKEDIKKYIIATSKAPDYVFLAICLLKNDEHIGNIKLGPIDPFHKFASMSLFIGQKRCWGKGYATEAISILSEVGFNRLKLNKITCGCYEPNIGSRKAFEKAGYALEGVFKKQYFYEGHRVDGFCLGLLKENWQKRKIVDNDE